MRVSREEIFGPVVSVIPYEDEADAVCEVARVVMERAALPAVDFSVPLLVEARAAADVIQAEGDVFRPGRVTP